MNLFISFGSSKSSLHVVGFVFLISTINTMYQGDGIRASLVKCRAYTPDTVEWAAFWIQNQSCPVFALNGKGLTRVNLLKYSLINHARTKGRLRDRSGDSIAREREMSARFLTPYSLSLLSFFQLLLHTSSSRCPLFFRSLTRFSCLINV